MSRLAFEPIDTWFFRDSTPFSTDSASQSRMGGLFPPHPSTTAGAVRAALARANGWNGRGRWPDRLNELLGDGPDDLGKLQIRGPVVLLEDSPLFPVPRHLLGLRPNGLWRPQAFLRPGPPVRCDLGQVRLPALSPSSVEPAELKTAENCWLTRAGFEAVLRGELPAADHVVPAAGIFYVENRVALQRNPVARTAEEGMLFAPRHVRFAERVALGIEVSGLPEDCRRPPDGAVVLLGGESRMALWRSSDWEFGLPGTPPCASESGRFALVALTPVELPKDVLFGREPFPVGPVRAEVICVCCERPMRIGGWSSLSHQPLPLRNYLAPGAVLFCRSQPPGVELANPLTIGTRLAAGFGLAAAMPWKEVEEAP